MTETSAFFSSKQDTARAPRGGALVFRITAGPWFWGAAALALLVAGFVAVVFASFLQETPDIWNHLAENVLPGVLVNTFWLVLGTGLGTLLLGTTLAFFTACCEFPGRRFFEWALMLPLAIPAYVLGFVWIGILDYSGFVPTLLRDWLGTDAAVPPIRSRGGVIFVMTLALYPYVYMLARNAFLTQGRSVIEAALSLGRSRKELFTEIMIPMARPWILGGLSLVMMETLADFGTVAVFNYDTFTTTIYKTWFSLFSLPAARQLSAVLVGLVFILLFVFQGLKGGARYALPARHRAAQARLRLAGTRGAAVSFYALAVLGLGFLIPVLQLGIWAGAVWETDLDGIYLGLAGRTLLLAALAAGIICAAAFVLTTAERRHPGWAARLFAGTANLGYAVPGTVLAVGVYSSLIVIDRAVAEWAGRWGFETGLPLTGTIAAMLIAYTVRFLAVGHQPVESAMRRITPQMEEAARSLGARGFKLFRRIQLPLLGGGLRTAFILVFVDVAKEMPITLMTRPFGWNTLAVRIFEMTSEGEWQRAALPAVILVIVGLMAVLFLMRREETSTERA